MQWKTSWLTVRVQVAQNHLYSFYFFCCKSGLFFFFKFCYNNKIIFRDLHRVWLQGRGTAPWVLRRRQARGELCGLLGVSVRTAVPHARLPVPLTLGPTALRMEGRVRKSLLCFTTFCAKCILTTFSSG